MRKSKIEVEDYVKVKSIESKNLGFTYDYHGRVEEIYSEWNGYLIRLDSLSLDQLDDETIIDSLKEEEDIFHFVFQLDDLEPHERRDTNELYEKAKLKIENRIDALENETEEDDDEFDENKFYKLKDKWTDEFEKSNFCTEIENEDLREKCNFIADSFMEYAYNYEGSLAEDWDEFLVNSVCLEWVPKKISADLQTFECYGDGLIQFFKFLDCQGYISNAKNLIEEVERIKDQIPFEASDTSNWGMAKSLAMFAQSEGIDFTNQEDMNGFIRKYNEDLLKDQIDNTPKLYDPNQDQFRDLGRNDKINVKYEGGRIVENVKFKKVEQDLKTGKCELIKK